MTWWKVPKSGHFNPILVVWYLGEKKKNLMHQFGRGICTWHPKDKMHPGSQFCADDYHTWTLNTVAHVKLMRIKRICFFLSCFYSYFIHRTKKCVHVWNVCKGCPASDGNAQSRQAIKVMKKPRFSLCFRSSWGTCSIIVPWAKQGYFLIWNGTEMSTFAADTSWLARGKC